MGLKVSETIVLGVDISEVDASVITVATYEGCRIKYINTITGKEAEELYEKITNKKLEKEVIEERKTEEYLLKLIGIGSKHNMIKLLSKHGVVHFKSELWEDEIIFETTISIEELKRTPFIKIIKKIEKEGNENE